MAPSCTHASGWTFPRCVTTVTDANGNPASATGTVARCASDQAEAGHRDGIGKAATAAEAATLISLLNNLY